MRKYKLFLDDTRIPSEVFSYINNPIYMDPDWVVVQCYDDFIQIIKERGIPYMISFDHDLADEHYLCQVPIMYGVITEKTGYHCASWLIYYCMDNGYDLPETILIHSMNPVGSQNIVSLFNTFRKVYGK